MRLRSLFILLFCLKTSLSFAFPTNERVPATTDAPLDILSSEPDQILVPKTGDFADRFILATAGNGIVIIDTETWELYTDQPSDFPTTVGGMVLLSDGNTLIVTLSDGNLGKIQLDNIAAENADVADAASSDSSSSSGSTTTGTSTDPRVIELSDKTSAGPLTAIAADPDIGESVVYFINTDDKLLDMYDVEDGSFTAFTLDATPHDIVFADTDVGQKVFVAASSGKIFTINAGGSSVVTVSVPIVAPDTVDPELVSLATTADGEFIYVVDTTNTVVWVLNGSTNAVEDQQSTSGTDPVRIDTADENTSLDDILVTVVTAPSDVYAYVSGEEGISILNASSPDIISDTRKIIDIDGLTSDVLDPLVLSGTPGPLAASSVSDGYVYAANGNATISIISDNPFVTIDATTAVTVNGTTTSFALSFQADEVGTYSVMANSNIDASSGTELATGTVDTADTAVATTIETASFDRDVFAEGTNRIFVFATDAAGHRGRDAYDITVDRPPPAVTVTGVNFGNKKVYVTFTKLSDEDISQYTIAVKPADNQTSPTCPGTVDFTDSPATGTVGHDSCTSPCTGSVTDLTNGTAYCVAVRATDDGGQVGEYGTFSTAVSPERTVGPAGLLGEAGCALRKAGDRRQESGVGSLFIIPVLFFVILRRRRRIYQACLEDPSPFGLRMTILLMVFLFSFPAFAADDRALNPGSKWFSFELKGGIWVPTNSVVQDFYGKWTNLMGEMEFGLLYKSRYNVTIGSGYLRESGNAVGITSGAPSGDKVTLLQIPIRANFIYRFDFKDQQMLVPYVGVGPDYVFFRENVGSDVTKGWKFGVHGMGGVAILLNRVEDIGSGLAESGIDDVYFTLEGRYSMINSFKSTGLDLSAIHIYAGVLLAF